MVFESEIRGQLTYQALRSDEGMTVITANRSCPKRSAGFRQTEMGSRTTRATSPDAHRKELTICTTLQEVYPQSMNEWIDAFKRELIRITRLCGGSGWPDVTSHTPVTKS
jgi:hypothetical protein